MSYSPALFYKVKANSNWLLFIIGTALSTQAFGQPIDDPKKISEGAVAQNTEPTHRFELRINPMGEFFGAFGGELDYAVLTHWSTGLSYTHFHNHTATRDSYLNQYGWSIDFFPFSPAYETGFLFRAEINNIDDLEHRVKDYTYVDTTNIYSSESLLSGYRWMLPNRVSFGIGAGVTLYQGPSGFGTQAQYLFQFGWSPI